MVFATECYRICQETPGQEAPNSEILSRDRLDDGLNAIIGAYVERAHIAKLKYICTLTYPPKLLT